MSEFSLVIGTKNVSSWSLRPWLLMKYAGAEFDEILIRLDQEDTQKSILAHNPAGWVPALKHKDRVIWDSMAICEYIAELYPEKLLWPAYPLARAHARSVCAEMHAGFQALRNDMPMACNSIFDGPELTEGLISDINRIKELWCDCRKKYQDGGPFLFGHFTIADSMFAPVVFRFRTYQVELEDTVKQYCKMMLELPAMREWFAGADVSGILE